MFDARSLSSRLAFKGGLPLLVLRDHEGGRIKVFRDSQWVATIVPGSLLCLDCEALLLSYPDSNVEWRGRLAIIAVGLNAFQQSNGDWNAADDAWEYGVRLEAWLSGVDVDVDE